MSVGDWGEVGGDGNGGVNIADWRLGTLYKLGKGVRLFSLKYGISLKDLKRTMIRSDLYFAKKDLLES